MALAQVQQHDERWERLRPALAACSRSTKAFCRLFMAERFYRPFNSLHDELFKLLDDESKQRVAVAAPRGFGKTSIDTIAFVARKVAFRQCRFVLVVSATNAVASDHVKNLARELTGNALIREVFGDLKGPTWAESSGDIVTSSGIRVLSRGVGQQIRGLLWGNSRPDLVLVDDGEDSEPFRLGDPGPYLKNTKEWFAADLMNSIDVKLTRVLFVGTVLHANSLLANHLESPDWSSVRIELCDDNYRSNFPDFMTDDQVYALAERYRREGMLDSFFREYRNLPIAREDAIFTQNLFKYWDPKEYTSTHRLVKCVIVDPAKTIKLHSDFSAIECWGFDPKANRFLLLDLLNQKLYPEQLYEAAWEMAVRNGAYKIGVEQTSLHEFITNPFNNYLSAKGFPPVIPLDAKGKKQDRIALLAPLYRMGAVYHHPEARVHGPLEAQLLAFPAGKKDDAADCAAYMPEMFGIGSQFFSMPEHEDEAAMAKELAELEAMEDGYDETLNWRNAP